MHKWGIASKTQLLKCLLPWALLFRLSSDISACHSGIWVMSLIWDFAKYASLFLSATYRQRILFPLKEMKYLQAVTYCKNLNEWSIFWKQMQAGESRDSKWERSCHGREAVRFIQASSAALAEPWKHGSQQQGVLRLGFWHSPLPWCKCTCCAVMDSKVNSLRVLLSNMKLILSYGSDSGEEDKKVCAGLDPWMSSGEHQAQVAGLWSFTRQLFWPTAICGSGVTGKLFRCKKNTLL